MIDIGFFKADDGGVRWHFVAYNLDHAQSLLAKSGTEIEHELEWTELTVEQARTVRCDTSEDNLNRGTIPLADCGVGEWFCSEW